jgi:hypothetical protein
LLETDYTNLTSSVDSIQAAESSLRGLIAKQKAAIKVLKTKIDSENALLTDTIIAAGVGLFFAIARIILAVVSTGALAGVGVVAGIGGVLATLGGTGGSIALGVIINQQHQEIANNDKEVTTEQAQIACLSALSESVDNLRQGSIKSQRALVSVRTFFTNFDKTLGDILAELKKAEDPIAIIDRQLHLDAAVNEWNDVKQYADLLLNLPIKEDHGEPIKLPKAA